MQEAEETGRRYKRLQQFVRRRLSKLLDRFQPPETAVLMGTALFVGLGAGLGAVVFRWLIGAVQTLSFTGQGKRCPSWTTMC